MCIKMAKNKLYVFRVVFLHASTYILRLTSVFNKQKCLLTKQTHRNLNEWQRV